MKKALILTGKLVQDHEFIYPYYRLKEAGYKVAVATKFGASTKGYLGTNIPCDSDSELIQYSALPEFGYDIDILVIPGGAKAMEYMRQEDVVLEYIAECDKKGIVIASICHGAQLLISAKVAKGRKISGYYSIKDDINNAGAEYVDEPVCIDGKIITSPHYKHLGPWMATAILLAP